jgi:hypothetical protein
MITVGNREVLFNRSFIIPIGEEAIFDTPFIAPGIKIALHFDDNSSEPSPVANWAFTDQILKITFKGWKNSLGTALKKPTKLGDLGDGRPFGFNIVHYFIGEVHFVTIELYAGGKF